MDVPQTLMKMGDFRGLSLIVSDFHGFPGTLVTTLAAAVLLIRDCLRRASPSDGVELCTDSQTMANKGVNMVDDAFASGSESGSAG